MNLPNGHSRLGTYYFQGLIRDTLAPNGTIAVTNGMVKVVK